MYWTSTQYLLFIKMYPIFYMKSIFHKKIHNVRFCWMLSEEKLNELSNKWKGAVCFHIIKQTGVLITQLGIAHFERYYLQGPLINMLFKIGQFWSVGSVDTLKILLAGTAFFCTASPLSLKPWSKISEGFNI